MFYLSPGSTPDYYGSFFLETGDLTQKIYNDR